MAVYHFTSERRPTGAL